MFVCVLVCVCAGVLMPISLRFSAPVHSCVFTLTRCYHHQELQPLLKDFFEENAPKKLMPVQGSMNKMQANKLEELTAEARTWTTEQFEAKVQAAVTKELWAEVRKEHLEHLAAGAASLALQRRS